MDKIISLLRCRVFKSFLCQERGAAAVEFALTMPLLLVLVGGILDFGHAWYMQHEISTASREGARYATRYQKSGGVHLNPNVLSPTIDSWVTSNYANFLPGDANLTVVPSGPGYNSGTTGDDLTITVSAQKTWFIIGSLVPGLGNSINLSAATTMKVE